MSDWEDEYNADGVAIQKPVTISARTECKQPWDDRRKESVSFGVRNGTKFGVSREGRADRSCGGFDEGRPRSTDHRSPGGRTFRDEKSDSSPPVIISVDTSLVGRIIG